MRGANGPIAARLALAALVSIAACAPSPPETDAGAVPTDIPPDDPGPAVLNACTGTAECPAGSLCIASPGGARCLRICAETSGCDPWPGFQCQTVTLDDGSAWQHAVCNDEAVTRLAGRGPCADSSECPDEAPICANWGSGPAYCRPLCGATRECVGSPGATRVCQRVYLANGTSTGHMVCNNGPQSRLVGDAPQNPCRGAGSCGACTPILECGWCDATGRCLPGSEQGPTTGGCGGDWVWLPSRCGSGPGPDASTDVPDATARDAPDGDAGDVPGDVARDAPDGDACVPNCAGRTCGPNGCGGTCGTCPFNHPCTPAGTCATACVPDCAGRACGPDGCDGSCGTCADFQTCTAQGQCTGAGLCPTTTVCRTRMCGTCRTGESLFCDACRDVSCGTCRGAQVCSPEGRCCDRNCAGRACGPDGCGGSCGACPTGQACNGAGACVCVPNCTNRNCGTDGCGGSCGSCPSGQGCYSGTCRCAPSCTGRVCGPDGCGGSCGTCTGGQTCNDAGRCGGCVRNCTGRACGPDGCGGSCGTCTGGYTCNSAGQCTSGSTCTDNNHCVETVSAVRGQSCGDPTSLDIRVRNRCTGTIAIQICIRRANGTCNCGLSDAVAPGGTMYYWGCATAGLWYFRGGSTADVGRGCFPSTC